MKLRILLLIMYTTLSLALFAQADSKGAIYIIPEEYSSIHHEGEKALLKKDYGEAVRLFKRVLKKYPDFPPALRSIGACYELMGDFEKAVNNYEAALASNPFFSRAMYYEIGNLLYKTGNYELALQSFEQFDTLLQLDSKQFTYNGFYEQHIEKEYFGKLEASRRACHIALDSVQFWNIKEVKKLSGDVNTKADEYFPFLTNDGQTLFYTSRKGESFDENLFVSQHDGKSWKSGEMVRGVNTKNNEGMATLVRDGRNVFFTVCERESVLGTCDIWKARLEGQEISDIEPSIGQSNSEAWESQASISCDGSVLYFASNREGGQGGTDIWKSNRLSNNQWSEPINLGDQINTPGDEEAPFITNDGQTLFFSSTGHIGLGEQDIFMSRQLGGDVWSQPINLGMPVNSSYRELGFFLSGDSKTGYFASDRNDGEGGMDIYYFQVPDTLQSDPVTFVEGQVNDSITHLPVRATVSIMGRETILTDEEGRFFMCVNANEELEIEVKHKDYYAYSSVFPIPEWDNTTFFELDILLDPLFKLPKYSEIKEPDSLTIISRLKPKSGKKDQFILYFDFDKTDPKTESLEEFNRFITAHFAEKEPAYIEIIGFSDQQGGDAYNVELSEKRAEAVGVYLKQKGIIVDDIRLEGKGKNQSDEANWKNRKVEVIIYLSD